MTNNYLSYGRARERIKEIARENPLFKNMMSIDDIDGVINVIKNLKFYDLAMTAYVALQPLFVNCEWLTGRFAQLFANEGIPRLEALGWDFDAPCGFSAEMGSVTLKPVERISKSERILSARIFEGLERQYVGKNKQWAAIANSPEIQETERRIIYSAFVRVLGNFVTSGELEHLKITRDTNVEELAPRIYDPELLNIFKGTLTTSMVAPEFKDLAFAVHGLIGPKVAIAINEDLVGYNSTAETRLIAVSHYDCVEVLFEGIAKLPTTIKMIQRFEAASGINLQTIMSKGDAYKDVEMARGAVQLGKTSIHFHFGHAGNFEDSLRSEAKNGLGIPDYTVLFPEYDDACLYNPTLTSVNTAATSLWSLNKVIRENPDTDNWHDLLGRITNAKVLTRDEVEEASA